MGNFNHASFSKIKLVQSKGAVAFCFRVQCPPEAMDLIATLLYTRHCHSNPSLEAMIVSLQMFTTNKTTCNGNDDY